MTQVSAPMLPLKVGNAPRSLPVVSRAALLVLALASLLFSARATAGTANLAVSIYSAPFQKLEERTQELTTASTLGFAIETSADFPNNASGSAVAAVDLVRGSTLLETDSFIPNLRARATGKMTTDGAPFDFPTEATAAALWRDTLDLGKVDPATGALTPIIPDDPFDDALFKSFDPSSTTITISTFVDGSIDNKLPARFDITLLWDDPVFGFQRRTSGMTFQGPRGLRTDKVRLDFPLRALLSGAELSVALSVTGGTDADKNDGTANFFNTARLLPILIADANGNHIPGSENLRILGGGGLLYQTGLVGDYNASGTVEQADLDLVLLNWGISGETPPAAWVNDLPTGLIDQQELDRVLLSWGNSVEAGLRPAVVPEPGVFILALLIISCVAPFKNRAW